MPIKIELSDIPTTSLAALTDHCLISYGYNGAARLLALEDMNVGSVFSANDGNLYRLVGTIVDGQVLLGSEMV